MKNWLSTYKNLSRPRQWAWAAMGFLLLLLIAFIILFFNAERIINKHLSNYIYEKTDGVYRFEFQSLDMNLRRKELTIWAIRFHPDSTKVDTSTRKFSLFESEKIVFKRFRLLRLLKNQNLEAEVMQVTAPRFFMGSGESIGMKNIAESALQAGDTLNLPLINQLILDTVRISDARLSIDTLLQSNNLLNKDTRISIELHEFVLGGIKTTNIPFVFDVKDLLLKFENLSGMLGDSLHSIKSQEVALSLLHPTINARNIEISPLPHNNTPSTNKYNVKLPEIHMICPGIEHYLTSDTIEVEQFEMVEPSIRIRFGTEAGKGTPLNKIDLFQLISHKYLQATVHKLKVTHGQIYLIPPSSSDTTQTFQNLNIELLNFEANSRSITNTDLIFNSQNIEMTLDTFTVNHTDKLHRLTMTDLELNTRNKTISTKNVHFGPISLQSTKRSDNVVDVTSGELSMTGVDFSAFFHQQKLKMNSLKVTSPESKLRFKTNDKNKTALKTNSFLFEKTRDYLQGIYVNSIVLNNGKLSYQYSNKEDDEGFFKTNFALNLQKFSLDSATFYQTDRIFHAQEFNLNFNNIKLELADQIHVLTTDSLHLSSNNQLARLTNFQISPKNIATHTDSVNSGNQNIRYYIHFPVILLSEANLHSAFFDKELLIKYLKVLNPSIRIENLARKQRRTKEKFDFNIDPFPLISNYIDRISITNASVEKGVFTFVQRRKGRQTMELSNNFDVALSGFELHEKSAQQKNRLLFSDFMKLTVQHYNFDLPDGVHSADAETITIDTKHNQIDLANVVFKPLPGTMEHVQTRFSYNAQTPHIQLNGVNIAEAVYSNKLKIAHLIIEEPTVDLTFHKMSKTPNIQHNKKQNLPDQLNQIDIATFTLRKGRLQLSNYETKKMNQFADGEIELNLRNLQIKNLQNEIDYTYSNATTTLQNFVYQTPNNYYKLILKELKYSQADSLAQISNFEWTPTQAFAGKTKVHAQIPSMQINGLNLSEFHYNNRFVARCVSLKKPKIQIQNESKESKFNLLKPNIYGEVSKLFKAMEIGKIDIEQGHFQHGTHTHQNTNVSFFQFALNENTNQLERFFYSDRIVAKIPFISGKTKKQFYNYRINNVIIDTKGTISAEQSTLEPAHSRENFFELKKFQDDYVTIKANLTTFTGVDFKKWIENKTFSAAKMETNIALADFFRDKRLLIDPAKRTKLPQQMLRELKTPLHINAVEININKLIYSELETESPHEATIFFDQVNWKSSNITNLPERLKTNPTCSSILSGKPMGISTLNIDLQLDLTSPNNAFTFLGTCEPIELSKLNPIIEPGLKLSIKEGFSTQFEARFHADEESANGELLFGYNNLKISLLSFKEGELKEDKFVSFLANTLAVKSDNPRQGRDLTPDKIENQRDKQRSIVNYVWKNIFAGIKETFGIKDKEKKAE